MGDKTTREPLRQSHWTFFWLCLSCFPTFSLSSACSLCLFVSAGVESCAGFSVLTRFGFCLLSLMFGPFVSVMKVKMLNDWEKLWQPKDFQPHEPGSNRAIFYFSLGFRFLDTKWCLRISIKCYSLQNIFISYQRNTFLSKLLFDSFDQLTSFKKMSKLCLKT